METERLLCAILREIADATANVDIEETDCGELYCIDFRYMPTFSFTKEDIETIKRIADKNGEDLSIITEI